MIDSINFCQDFVHHYKWTSLSDLFTGNIVTYSTQASHQLSIRMATPTFSTKPNTQVKLPTTLDHRIKNVLFTRTT